MQPRARGPALWLRRARELLSDLQAHAETAAAPHTTPAAPFRPPDWLRPPWDPPTGASTSTSTAPQRPWSQGTAERWSGSAFRAPAPPTHARAHNHPPSSTGQPPGAHATAQLRSTVGVSASQTAPPPQNTDTHTHLHTHEAHAAAAAQRKAQWLPRQTDALAPVHKPPTDESAAGARMREVLRSVAQPVVVAVVGTGNDECPYHGATLTSFASLTLEPHPLVAFSLRLPSRMADYLRPPYSVGGHAGQPIDSTLCSPRAAPTKLTVSLLASANQAVADELARPGADHSAIFRIPDWDTRDPPALRSAVGCLECQVVHSLPLRDVGGDTASDNLGSELFICRVTDAHKTTGEDSLVHFQRDYFSVAK